MAGGKWDYYKVRSGTKLTRSKATHGAHRGLVHGKKGVEKQAEFFKVERKGSFFRALMTFAGKCLAVVVAFGAAVTLASRAISAMATGAASGFSSVTQAISASSSYLVVGVSIAAALVVLVLSVKFATSMGRRGIRRSVRAVQRAELVEADQSGAKFAAQRGTGLAAATPALPLHAVPIPPNWYPDPYVPSQVRYWNGLGWTEHVRQLTAARPAPAGWYPPSSGQTQLRYWNGTVWTDHWAAQNQLLTPQPPVRQPSTQPGQIPMSSVEWQSLVRAWMAAGAVEQELWRRLSNAQITDDDHLTLEAQRRMEGLTAEQGSQQVRLMLESNPGLRDEAGVSDFLTLFVNSVTLPPQRARVGIGQVGERKWRGDSTGLV